MEKKKKKISKENKEYIYPKIFLKKQREQKKR